MMRPLCAVGVALGIILGGPLAGSVTDAPSAPVLLAQDRGERERHELAEKIRERFYERARQQVELSDREFDELRSILKDFREPRVALHRERRELRKEKAEVSEAPSETVEDVARAIVERRAELRAREERLENREEEQLLELLGPQRLLQFQELRERFNQRVQKLQVCEDYRDRRGSRR